MFFKKETLKINLITYLNNPSNILQLYILCNRCGDIVLTLGKEAGRNLMIRKQGIHRSYGTSKTDIYNMVERLGCIQIDTINVVERAHYLTLWTRLGNYNKNHLWDLAYQDRQLFEYMAHAASYIPFKDYRFYLHAMKVRRGEISERFKRRSNADPEVLDRVLERIRDEGPLSSKDFEGPKRIGSWWNWKPAKLALELFYRAGILLIHHRENFQKYYDLAENIIPGWVDTETPDEGERVEFFTIKTLECLGLTRAREVREYYHHHSIKLERPTKEIQDILDHLVMEGEVVKIDVKWDKDPYYCLSEDHDLLNDLTGNPFVDDVALVGYFDNFMWIRDRISLLFDFKPKLEIYLPREERIYGYYHVPILYGDKLVARIEPKMDRSRNKLMILGYWPEDGFEPTDEYEDKLWENLESFAKLNGADEISWEEYI
jgi:hypothetical protein